jgi:hypothetical protein
MAAAIIRLAGPPANSHKEPWVADNIKRFGLARGSIRQIFSGENWGGFP